MIGHVVKRLQQRALPLLVLDWLETFGEEHEVGLATLRPAEFILLRLGPKAAEPT